MIRLLRAMALCLGLAFLAACNNTEPPRIPTFTPVFSQDPTLLATLAVNCPRADLERWLQKSVSLTEEFYQTINSQLATPPDQLGPVVGSLNSVRAVILGSTYPACAEGHFITLSTAMDDLIRMLDNYRRGEPLDLTVFANLLSDSRRTLNDYEVRLTELYKSLTQ
jgi:hypothetical protein